ncbi:MAG: S1 family peptidase [Verrucomicrobiales bacterium]
MMPPRLILILICLTAVIRGTELVEVVWELKIPSLATAKIVLEKLDRLIENGDARTVTLGKKVQRSVKRIFTKEHKVLAGKKDADDREAEARQLDRNRKQWLKPNVFGNVNKGAASAAFRRALELRNDNKAEHASLTKEWVKEIADFEKMLGDLEFSKEDEALLILAELMQAIVKRTPWVGRPSLSYDESRAKFLSQRIKNRGRFLALARHASDAGDYELSYHFHRLVGNDLARIRIGAKLANRILAEGKPGSAINRWERIGNVEEVKNLKLKHPALTANSYQAFDEASLNRFVAPACVRVLVPGGHRTGFFYQQGGYLLTCRHGLLNGEGQPHALVVVLEDGRKFPATILGFSSGHDIAALKIDHSGHELLPLADRIDLKQGGEVTLFGFSDSKQNTAIFSKGAIMVPFDTWQNQPTSRWALDGSAGHRGAPLVDSRGRVLGIFIASKTGTARSLEIGAIRGFLKAL